MRVYRSSMEKILDQQEENLPITNPNEPFKTFWRKMLYRWTLWKDKARRRFEGTNRS
jgi:hypothetical protein